jgi:hypothetical protein
MKVQAARVSMSAKQIRRPERSARTAHSTLVAGLLGGSRRALAWSSASRGIKQRHTHDTGQQTNRHRNHQTSSLSWRNRTQLKKTPKRASTTKISETKTKPREKKEERNERPETSQPLRGLLFLCSDRLGRLSSARGGSGS